VSQCPTGGWRNRQGTQNGPMCGGKLPNSLPAVTFNGGRDNCNGNAGPPRFFGAEAILIRGVFPLFKTFFYLFIFFNRTFLKLFFYFFYFYFIYLFIYFLVIQRAVLILLVLYLGVAAVLFPYIASIYQWFVSLLLFSARALMKPRATVIALV
jgi:hypothetical protein